MAMRAALLLALVAVLAFYAAPADAGYQGFYSLAAFQAYDFMVDTYVDLIPNALVASYIDYVIGYYTDTAYTDVGSFPLYLIYASDYSPGCGIACSPVYGYSFLNDYLFVQPSSYIGLYTIGEVNALGFFLSDLIDHNRYGFTYGEYINRVVYRNGFYYTFDYDGFKGINDVFVGFIDSTGFEGLWAGWYDGFVLPSRDVDSAMEQGIFNGFYHFLTPAAYVGAGGDPHMIARATRSEMTGVIAGDIVNLVDHPEVSVNAAIREFDFLPESMRENSYFGTVAVQLANGDRVLVAAFEDEEGAPAYSVTFNGAEVALGGRIDNGDVLVHLDSYEALDKAHGQSWFQEQFPSQTHAAIARVWVRDHIVIDVSLSSKEAFIDWQRGDPQIYRTPGAFLNVNMRDLVQDAQTRGLLRAVDAVHQRKNMRERALEKGTKLQERDIDVNFDGLVAAIVDQHRVSSLF